MVRTGLSIIIAVGMFAASVTAVAAQQFGTAAEARAMLERAALEIKASEAAAIGKFSDKDNKSFRDRDLYVFCFRMNDGIITTHPNPLLVGTDLRNLKVKDDPLGQRLFDEAKEGTVATVNYNFPKPGTTDSATKETFVTRIGNQSCGVGYYK